MDATVKIRASASDRVFDIVNNAILILIILICVYPLYFVVIASISDPDAVNTGAVLFLPRGGNGKLLNFEGYMRVFQDYRIWRGYGNTLFYTACGTLLGVVSTVLAGYSLSRSDLAGRGFITGMFVFTMYFSGGLIPTYLVIKNLNLTNTPWVMILYGSVSVYNIIIAKSFFQNSLSEELQDAAFIDGCGNGKYFAFIVVPLSKAIIAVLTLYYAVGHWNTYFNALIYLNDEKLYPLQLILRDILIASQMVVSNVTDMESIGEAQRIAASLKYAVIIVSTLPVLVMYPFLQRYFVKGVMIGAVKG
ncbi:carbohydrate ABC transporter permease [Ruminococcaceae bacterium OttesenSCG-928-L11]|nr:carbohydrate ABC transporter permease [Ruminococcaceae bacterium OttesenSCG-928-L11]